MKDGTAGVAIEEFVELKPKMYSYLVNDNSENKKEKGIFLNKKCFRHSMNRIQSKDHKIEPMKIARFLYLALMTKYLFKTTHVMD